ncbi:MAG: hypothetical protein RLZZ600_463 [Actinomycetota bacterium]
MSKKTSTARSSLLSLAGVGGALLAGVVVAAAVVTPIPTLSLTPASLVVSPTQATQKRVCPGGLVDILSRDGDATTYQGFAAPNIVTEVIGSVEEISPLPAPDNVATNPEFGPSIISAAPSGNAENPTLVAASQTQAVAADSVSGLAAASCGEGSTNQWLVGGSTEVGRNSLLMLSNVLDVDATVSIEIFGEKGQVDAAGMAGLVVKAKTQRIISLAAFAPNLVEPVVHVTTTGGQVLASMQQTTTRVVTASGVDFVQPGAAPARTQIIPGVALSGMADQDGEGGTVTSDLAPTIRVFIPGPKSAEVSVNIIGPSGKPVVVKARVEAGRTLQLPFTGATDGIYTVVVTADVELVAGVRTIQAAGTAPAPLVPVEEAAAGSGDAGTSVAPTTAPAVKAVSKTGGDFAWIPAALPLSDVTVFTVPAGPRPTLTLYNPTARARSMSITTNGERAGVELAAGASVVVPLTAGSKMQLGTAEGMYATVTYAAVGQGSAFSVAPASRLSSALRIYAH